MGLKNIYLLLSFLALLLLGCSDPNIESGESIASIIEPENPVNPVNPENPSEPDPSFNDESPACIESLYFDQLQPIQINASCKKANQSQLDQVNLGNQKRDQFLSQCFKATNNSCWCDQLVRPNPDSFSIFQCTYGVLQPHQLIHPDESTWAHAFEAVKIVEELEKKNILTKIIYNWWRPEPYNKNVAGASGRHDLGTSVDVLFKTKEMQNIAFNELCKMRKQGRVRAVGYYTSASLHFGIGDKTANTWGKSCP